jgi:hypothetical protein
MTCNSNCDLGCSSNCNDGCDGDMTAGCDDSCQCSIVITSGATKQRGALVSLAAAASLLLTLGASAASLL